jgi:hypothetical protein
MVKANDLDRRRGRPAVELKNHIQHELTQFEGLTRGLRRSLELAERENRGLAGENEQLKLRLSEFERGSEGRASTGRSAFELERELGLRARELELAQQEVAYLLEQVEHLGAIVNALLGVPEPADELEEV